MWFTVINSILKNSCTVRTLSLTCSIGVVLVCVRYMQYASRIFACDKSYMFLLCTTQLCTVHFYLREEITINCVTWSRKFIGFIPIKHKKWTRSFELIRKKKEKWWFTHFSENDKEFIIRNSLKFIRLKNINDNREKPMRKLSRSYTWFCSTVKRMKIYLPHPKTASVARGCGTELSTMTPMKFPW